MFISTVRIRLIQLDFSEPFFLILMSVRYLEVDIAAKSAQFDIDMFRYSNEEVLLVYSAGPFTCLEVRIIRQPTQTTVAIVQIIMSHQQNTKILDIHTIGVRILMTRPHIIFMSLSIESRRGRCSFSFACFIIFFAMFRRSLRLRHTGCRLRINIQL